MGYRLGIDLGTTFTAAAYIENAGPRMLELGIRNLTVPSVLFLTEEHTMLFGEAAERRSWSEPERVLREFKRRIGDTVPMLAGGQTFDPSTLQTELLRRVLQLAEERLAGPPDHVVVTHPASWGLFKLQLMRDILAGAGIPGASLCPEPVAAAIEYAAKQRVPVGAKVAVYDLGGGTFDIAVLEKTDDGFEIVGTPLGVDHLGGLDFDEAVLADTVYKLGLGGVDPEDPAVARGLTALRRDCVEAKEALSGDVATDISTLIPGGTGHRTRLSRGELETLIRPAIEETVRTTVRALRMAGTDHRDLHALVLVGGSSRIPLVTELLNREFAVPVATDTFPQHDIALGAARFALLQAPEPSDRPRPTGGSWGGASGRFERSLRSEEGETPLSNQSPPTAPNPPAPAKAASPRSPSSPPVPTGVDDHAATSTAPNPAAASTDRPYEVLTNESEPRSRKLSARLIIAIIVVCLAAGTGIVVAGLKSGAGRSASPGGQSAANGQSEAPAPSTSVSEQPSEQPAADLPVSDPLPETQLLVPRYKKLDPPSHLWLADTENPKASRRIKIVQHGSVYGVGVSPDRRTVTYIDSGRAMRVISAAGGQNRRLFAAPKTCGRILHASWSSTDLSIFVLECQKPKSSSRLLVVNIDGTVVHELDTDGMHAADPTISPDGKSVAFSASKSASQNEGGSIYVMPMDGSSGPRQLTNSETDADSDPGWSPNGDSLAFRRRIGPAYAEGTTGNTSRENTDILIVPAAGGSPRTLVSGPATDDKPTWSPDGRTIAFISNRASDGSKADQKDLWLVPAAGGEPTPVQLPSPRFAAPTWWHR